MTIHVSLPKELERLVHKQVETGLYASASEVIREALREYFFRPTEFDVMDVEVRPRLEALLNGEIEAEPFDLDDLKKWREETLEEMQSEKIPAE